MSERRSCSARDNVHRFVDRYGMLSLVQDPRCPVLVEHDPSCPGDLTCHAELLGFFAKYKVERQAVAEAFFWWLP